MKTVFKYIEFKEVKSDRKTKVWTCFNIGHGVVLGVVEWEIGWRQYIFSPHSECIFSKGCLDDIASFLSEANIEHKQLLTQGDKR